MKGKLKIKGKDAEATALLQHFSPSIGEDIQVFARDVALEFSRYIFTERRKSKRFGYCTHCHSEFPIKSGDVIRPRVRKSGEPMTLTEILTGSVNEDIYERNMKPKMYCPDCGSLCTVKASGRGRKYMVDYAYFVYYEKSIQDPDVIVARGIRVRRDYRGDYRKVQTEFYPEALYVFEMGRPTMLKKYYEYYKGTKGGWKHRVSWEKRRTVFPLYRDQWITGCQGYQTTIYYEVIRTFVCETSIERAVTGTPFQYSQWEDYIGTSDMTNFFSLYTKAPCIEYLTKLGFSSLIEDKMRGEKTYGAINWRGKNLTKVLRLTKQDLAEIKAQGIEVTFNFLRLVQMFRKSGENLTLAEISEIDQAGYYVFGDYYLDIFKSVLEHLSVKEAHKYFKKQSEKAMRSEPVVYCLPTWRDYIADCQKLNMDLTDPKVMFPPNLHRAHQNTIKQVKLKADKELNKKIRARLKTLNKKYYFENRGLLVRPALSTNELINEGKALQHCVGTYAQGYADGTTILLVIRKKRDPDTPYFTMEIRDNRVIQCRGLRNCAPDKKVNTFVEAFETAKMNKKPAKQRIKVSA